MNKEPGYVYILTNPSFREDWVKIGKSSRPVDVRSKELDNTAVPLPFEIFATMKTVKYNEAAETLAHPQHPARRPGSSQFCWLNKSRQEIEKENDENGYKPPRAHIIYTPMSNGKKR